LGLNSSDSRIINTVTSRTDEAYFTVLESQSINEITIRIEDLVRSNYHQIKFIARCNFCVVEDYHQAVLDILCMILDCSLALLSVCVQKDDNFYRKPTNSSTFNKPHMIKLLEIMLTSHPYFPARGGMLLFYSHQWIIPIIK
jgi:hypothetical protein